MYIVDPVYQTLGLALPLLFANITLWVGLCPFSPAGLTVICVLYAVGYMIATTAVIVATLYITPEVQLHQPANNEAPSPNLNEMPKMTEKKEPPKKKEKEEKEEKEEAPKKVEKKKAPKKEEKQEAPKKAEKKKVPKKEVPIKVSITDETGKELQSEQVGMLMNALMQAVKKVATVHLGIWVDDCVFLTFYEIPEKKPGEKDYEYGRFHYFYREISLDDLNKKHPNIRIRPGQKRVFYKLKPEKLAEWKLAKDEIGHDPQLPRLYSNKPGGLLI